jgi:tetratricopeptide (TPR) repeat protein
MGTLLLQTGRMQESLEMNVRSLETRMALAADYPEEPLFKANVAASHNNVGVLHQRLDQPEQASEQYAEAIRIREQMVADYPDITQYLHQLAETHRVWGSLLSSQQQFDDALAEFQQAQQIYENLPEGTVGIGQSRWRLAETHQMIGDLYADFDRPDDATTSYRRALEIRQHVLRDHAERADYQVELSVNHRVLGDHLREMEQLDAAEAQLQQSVQILDQLGDQMKGNPQVDVIRASSLRGLAQVEFERENWPAARDWINQALQLDRGAVEAAPDNGEFAASLRSDRYWEASISIADGDLAAATRIADELVAAGPEDEDAHYQAARIHVRCLTAVQDDAELSPDQRTNSTDSYTSQALERLQQAVRLDPDLEIDREDFQPLLTHPQFPKLEGQ